MFGSMCGLVGRGGGKVTPGLGVVSVMVGDGVRLGCSVLLKVGFVDSSWFGIPWFLCDGGGRVAGGTLLVRSGVGCVVSVLNFRKYL